jgi:hypothetical protein
MYDVFHDHGMSWAESTRADEPPKEPEPNLICYNCGQGIYEGERYYSIDGKDYCEQCTEFEFGRFA